MNNTDVNKKIILCGEGGQGLQLVGQILTTVANEDNLATSMSPSFGVEQRGGVSLAYIQIGKEPIIYPRFSKADLILAMSNRAIEKVKGFIDDKSLLIYDCGFIEEEYLGQIKDLVKNFWPIPARVVATEKFSPKATNMIFLGAIVSQLGNLDALKVEKFIENKFKDKPEVVKSNIEAFRYGLKLDKSENHELIGCKKPVVKEKFEGDKFIWERSADECKGCGLCVEICPVKAIKMGEELNFMGTNLPEVSDKCIACGKCQQICPDGAIKVQKKQSN